MIAMSTDNAQPCQSGWRDGFIDGQAARRCWGLRAEKAETQARRSLVASGGSYIREVSSYVHPRTCMRVWRANRYARRSIISLQS